MGYLPKHIKVRRHKWNVTVIANAALAGCMFERVMDNWPPAGHRWRPAWCIRYADGRISRNYDTKGEAAATYLLWWLDKQGMWPKRRSA